MKRNAKRLMCLGVCAALMISVAACAKVTKEDQTTSQESQSQSTVTVSDDTYNILSKQSGSMDILLQKGTFTAATLDEETMLKYAVERLRDSAKNDLKNGVIDDTQYQMKTMLFYKSDIDKITQETFDRKVENYNYDWVEEDLESGGFSVTYDSPAVQHRFVSTENEAVGNTINATFDVYTFAENETIDDEALRFGDAKYDDKKSGVLKATLDIVDNSDGTHSIRFRQFEYSLPQQ